jgi:hypothetical protein
MCPANCADVELTALGDAGCEPKIRKRGLYKLLMYSCSTTLPEPLTCENLLPLLTSGAVVATSPLVNVEFADPEFEELVVADCLPAIQNVVSRTLTFQDRIAIDVPEGASGVPAAIPYQDLQYWGNKKKLSLSLRYLFLWCDGVVDKAIDELTGKPMVASLTIFRSFERQGSGGNSYTAEIKKGSVVFKGDPLALTEDYEPALVIDSVECDELATLLGLDL